MAFSATLRLEGDAKEGGPRDLDDAATAGDQGALFARPVVKSVMTASIFFMEVCLPGLSHGFVAVNGCHRYCLTCQTVGSESPYFVMKRSRDLDYSPPFAPK